MSEKTDSRTPEISRLLGALGLCARARAILVGTDMICEALRGRVRPRLVIEAEDTSDGTHKKLNDKCNFYRTPIRRVPVSGAELAAAVGKGAVVAALAITDENLSHLVESTLAALPAPESKKT